MIRPILLSLAVAVASPAPARPRLTSKCLDYSDPVTLTGTLRRRTYPGRPNFESIRDGDEPEVGYYLDLPAPICTLASGGSEARKAVRMVQLVLDSAGYARLRPRLGHRVAVRGVLFSSFTGHHHAPLLLRVAARLP